MRESRTPGSVRGDRGNPVPYRVNHSPWRGCWRGGEQILHKGDEILFGAGIADRATDRSGGDVESGDQGFRAMPDVFEFTPFDMPWLHGQAFGGPFQGLDPGHLVDRNGLTTLFGHGGRRLIYRADIGALLVEGGVWFSPLPPDS